MRTRLAALMFAIVTMAALLAAAPASATPPGRDGQLVGLWGNGRLALMSTDAQWVGLNPMHLREVGDLQLCPNGVHFMFDGEYLTHDRVLKVAMFAARWNGTHKRRMPYLGVSPMCVGHGRFDYLGVTRHEVPVIRQGSWNGSRARRLFALRGMDVGVPLKLSPDHRWIAFPGVKDPPQEVGYLWLVHPDGTGLHHLPVPANTVVENDFDWAPDSGQLLFGARGPYPPGDIGEYLVNPDGTGLHRIANGVNGFFSPSGTRIFHVAPHRLYELMSTSGGDRTEIPLPNEATLANHPAMLAWDPITTRTRSTLSFGVVRKDRWTFTLTGRIGPVGERLQRVVVTKYQRRAGGRIDAERHLVISDGPTFSTWLADDRPYNHETCTVRVHFLGDPVSLPTTRVMRFRC